MSDSPHITERQKAWFASIRAGIERDTGISFPDWVQIAHTCPETTHKARLQWFKQNHGLGVNRASSILGAAFDTGAGWNKPDVLLDRLWKTTKTRAVYDAIANTATALGADVVVGPRKSFSGFSRNYQFAAARPTREGIRLGVAVPLENAHGCEAPKSSDSWSGRLKAVLVVQTPEDINENIQKLLSEAYNAS